MTESTTTGVHRVSGARDLVRVLRTAVREGRSVAVHPDRGADLVLDLGGLASVGFDDRFGAFAVGAGAHVRDVRCALRDGWGVVLPAGDSPDALVGDHLAGGGYGSLSRRHGLTVDHLYAVEVVVVDADGEPRAVVATREPTDPHHDLWWAHTGGGGGFGVPVRYWFRSPGATGGDPTTALPRPPAALLCGSVLFPRTGFDRDCLRALARNQAAWLAEHSDVGAAGVDLVSELVLPAGSASGLAAIAFAQVDASLPHAQELLAAHFAALTAGVGGSPVELPAERLSWEASTRRVGDATGGGQAVKTAHHRAAFTDAQLDALWTHLSATDEDPALVVLESIGGRTNTVAPDATAVAQRDSLLRVVFLCAWTDPDRAASGLDRVRRCFRDVYADTGGVPVPDGAVTDGCFLDHPDADLADPEWNTSGSTWHDLFHKGNHPRLRAVRAAWDPRGVFGGQS